MPISRLISTSIISGLIIITGSCFLTTACDSRSTSAVDPTQLNHRLASPANQPPRVMAGFDRIVALSTSVQLSGSATDDGRPINPGILTTTWTQVSGPANISFANPHAEVTTTSFPLPGSYVLRLTANDGALSAQDDVRFNILSINTPTVSLANQRPRVMAGFDATVEVSSSVQLSGSATDDGRPLVPGALTTTWTLASGPAAINFANPNALVTTTLFPLEGTYVLRLTASDGALSTHDDVEFTVFSLTPFFSATEGPTGTENQLDNLEALHFGTATLNGGPTPGTLVRITNRGASDMHLNAPYLFGNHPNDFYVRVDSTSEPALGLVSAETAFEARSPFKKTVNGSAPLSFTIDTQLVAAIASAKRLDLYDFELPNGDLVTLDLVRRPLPFKPTADPKLVVDGKTVENGLRNATLDLQIFSGVIKDVPGSRVFMTLSPKQVYGFIERPSHQDGTIHLGTSSTGRGYLITQRRLDDLGLMPQELCAGTIIPPGATPGPHTLPAANDPSTVALTLADVAVAFETDHQLFLKFGNSDALISYVTSLVAAVSDQYLTDVATTISIAYLGVHTTSNDGWTTQETPGGDSGDLLSEFQARWFNNFPVPADLAHFLSGAVLGGGVAAVDALCSQTRGFAVSSNLTGTINWDTWNGQAAGFTWDFVVVAHELGHNFGSEHTHDYCPTPLDLCAPVQYWGSCQQTRVCTQGTIMSYCHLCSGGMANIDLNFHPVTAEIMRREINASCVEQATVAPEDYVQYRVGFNPITATGNRSVNLRYQHNAPNVSEYFRLLLYGTAN